MSDLTTTRDHLRRLADTGHRSDCCQCGKAYCCGCISHPIGKPWGWAVRLWDEHAATCPRANETEPCPGCLTTADRDLARRLADEIDTYLDDDGQEPLL